MAVGEWFARRSGVWQCSGRSRIVTVRGASLLSLWECFDSVFKLAQSVGLAFSFKPGTAAGGELLILRRSLAVRVLPAHDACMGQHRAVIEAQEFIGKRSFNRVLL